MPEFVKNSRLRVFRSLQKAINLRPSMTKGKIRASGLNIIRKESAAISALEAYINDVVYQSSGTDCRM